MLYMTPQIAPTTDPRSAPYTGACGVPWGVRWVSPSGVLGSPPGGSRGGLLGAPGPQISPELSLARTQVVLIKLAVEVDGYKRLLRSPGFMVPHQFTFRIGILQPGNDQK